MFSDMYESGKYLVRNTYNLVERCYENAPPITTIPDSDHFGGMTIYHCFPNVAKNAADVAYEQLRISLSDPSKPMSPLPKVQNMADMLAGLAMQPMSPLPDVQNAADMLAGLAMQPTSPLPNVQNAADMLTGLAMQPTSPLPNVQNAADMLAGLAMPTTETAEELSTALVENAEVLSSSLLENLGTPGLVILGLTAIGALTAGYIYRGEIQSGLSSAHNTVTSYFTKTEAKPAVVIVV